MVYKDFYHVMLERFSQPVELVTEAKQLPFSLYAEKGKLFVINGKHNTSLVNEKEVAAFIERYEQTESLSVRDYQDVTFKASYLLAALKYITKRDISPPLIFRFHSEELQGSEKKYKDWLADNPAGFVLNLLKRSDVSDRLEHSAATCLHYAQCPAVNNEREYSQASPFTGGDYFKICSSSISDLESEAVRITKLATVKRHACLKNKC